MQAPSHTLLGISQDAVKENAEQVSFSATEKAYATADLEQVHELLENEGYDEDETASFKVGATCQYI